MKELYAHALKTQWLPKSVQYVKNAGSQKLAVIIDPRYDDLMLSVIKNFMYYLNPVSSANEGHSPNGGWNFLVVSHASHLHKVRADLPGVPFMPIDNAFLEDGHKPNMSIDSYNRILMDRDLWHSMPAEHILIFQTDCYMFKMFDESKYLPYDYVGANWFSPADTAFFEGGVNGGCSLRRRSAMLDCLQYVSWELIEQVRQNQIVKFGIQGRRSSVGKRNEDVFYTIACEILHKKMVPIEKRPKFAIECEFDEDTCFYHGWNKGYQTEAQARTLLKNFA
jgi:hypothetical protein